MKKKLYLILLLTINLIIPIHSTPVLEKICDINSMDENDVDKALELIIKGVSWTEPLSYFINKNDLKNFFNTKNNLVKKILIQKYCTKVLPYFSLSPQIMEEQDLKFSQENGFIPARALTNLKVTSKPTPNKPEYLLTIYDKQEREYLVGPYPQPLEHLAFFLTCPQCPFIIIIHEKKGPESKKIIIWHKKEKRVCQTIDLSQQTREVNDLFWQLEGNTISLICSFKNLSDKTVYAYYNIKYEEFSINQLILIAKKFNNDEVSTDDCFCADFHFNIRHSPEIIWHQSWQETYGSLPSTTRHILEHIIKRKTSLSSPQKPTQKASVRSRRSMNLHSSSSHLPLQSIFSHNSLSSPRLSILSTKSNDSVD